MKIAIIPARGGSKRIPRKNIRQFGGRPMIAWPIALAADSGFFDRILVSTDDDEIAQLAEAEGAEVPFRRPPELSDDHCGTVPVIAHATQCALELGWPVVSVCCLYATAALLTKQDLAGAHDRLIEKPWDYVFAAARYSHPVQRGFLRAELGGVNPLFENMGIVRSQDLPNVYHDAGQFYWGRTQTWLEQRPIFTEQSTFIELPPWRAQDIDVPEDWIMAAHMFAAIRK